MKLLDVNRTATWLCALTLASSALGATSSSAAPKIKQRSQRTILDFESQLKDENNKPVSGIFPMEFSLLKPKAKRAFWKEKHWVAVDNGRYTLRLGRSSKLPKNFDPKTAVIEVGIRGAGRVLREPLSGASASLAQVDDSPSGGKRIVQYAEKSGFAYDAEHATIADRIGPFNGKDLQDRIEALEKRKSRVTVGRNRINLTSAGGVGGNKFEQICPKGTVAVGIRGGAGIYIDNFQVVCAPLE